MNQPARGERTSNDPSRTRRRRTARCLSGCVAILASAATAAAAIGPADVRSLAPTPAELAGWTETEPARVLGHDDLFELIDGGAELYHEYGFRQVFAGRYARGTASLQLEIYEMADAPAACGVYSLMQSGNGTPLQAGQAARLFDEYAVLWQDRFYVSITLTGAGARGREELAGLAAAVARRIPGTGPEPDLAHQLPAPELREWKYVRGGIALSNVHVFGAGNPFGVKEGVSGTYPDGTRFVFRYATGEEAAARLRDAARVIAADRTNRGFVERSNAFEFVDSDGRRVEAACDGRHIRVKLDPAG